MTEGTEVLTEAVVLPTRDLERQKLLASMAHNLMGLGDFPEDWRPEQRAMALAKRQLAGLELLGWSFSREEREVLR